MNEKSPPTVHVNGQGAREISMLVSPPAFLVTRKDGTHEITRVFYTEGDPMVVLNSERPRIGGMTVRAVEIDAERGARLTFDTGQVVVIPASRLQYTYLPA